MVVIDRDYMTFGGFIQSTTTTIDNQVNSSYIYITLKYAHCIKAVDRLNTSLIHISGDCHSANRASYEDRSQDVTSISNATFFGPDGNIIKQKQMNSPVMALSTSIKLLSP